MELPRIFKEMDGSSQGSVPLTQGKILANYVSDPTANLAGFRSSISSYKDFVKNMTRTDRESAKRLLNDTAIEVWKEQQKNGEYEDPRMLSYAVAAHVKGLPKRQKDLEKYLNHLRDTDFERFVRTTDEIAYLSDMTEEAMYGPGGFLLCGGPAPSKATDPETQLISIHDPFPIAVKSTESKLLEILSKNKPDITYEKRRLRKPKAVLKDFDYDGLIKSRLEVAGIKKKVNKIFYTACKNIEKSDRPASQKQEVKLVREMFQNKEHYHPVRNKVIMGTLITLASLYAAERVYSAIQNNPIQNNNFDDDRDGLLNGTNETLQKNSNQAQRYLSAGILHRVNDDGTLTFFGEKTLGSDPHTLSPAAVDQASFLSAISQTEYNKIKADGNLANFNIDGDLWSNRFEQIIGSPYNVKNDIYPIILAPSDHDYAPVADVESFFKDGMKIPAENIHRLDGGNNTSTNFEDAVNDIAKKAGKNDIVYVDLRGHGYVDKFFFENRWTNYKWIDEKLDKINSKLMFVIVDACHSGSSIDDLNGSGRIVFTSGTDTQRPGSGLGSDFVKAFSNSLADTNNDHHVSIEEAAEYAKSENTWTFPESPEKSFLEVTPQISDPDNLASSSYLIELKLEG